jgi:acylglycerol lipase
VRNTDIYYQAWLPDGEAKAALQLIHGLGSHSGRYMNVVGYLVPRGIAVYGHDHLGHGKSGGARGMIERFEDFTGTIAPCRDKIRNRLPEKPVFLFGHSMGGLIATHQLIDRQSDYQGAILSAPALKIQEGISPLQIIASQILARVAPRAGLLRLDPNRLSHDPEVVNAYRNDPLVFHGRTPARLAVKLMNAMQQAAQRMETITLPLLIFLGSRETIVNPGGAQMLYDGAGSKDKTFRIYEGLYHETFNEPERARVLGDIAVWLESHI